MDRLAAKYDLPALLTRLDVGRDAQLANGNLATI